MPLKGIICNILFFILRQKRIAFLEPAPSKYLKSTFGWNSAKLMQASAIARFVSYKKRNELLFNRSALEDSKSFKEAFVVVSLFSVTRSTAKQE